MDEGNVAQERTHEDEARTPDERTQGVEGEELRVGVAGDAGRDRDERAHEGDEAPDEERTPTVVRKVVLGLLQVLRLQHARVGLEEAAPPLSPQKVADLGADEGRDDNQGDQCGQVQAEAVVQEPGSKEHGLARQDGEEDP